MTDCKHCQNGQLHGDIECVNGVVIDIDEFTEGYPRDVIYPAAPCHPNYCRTCLGHGDHDGGDCPDCEGTGYRGAKNDSQQRLAAATN